MSSNDPKPYGFDPMFEQQAVTLTCCNQQFYGRIGHALDPESLSLASAKTALLAAQAIGRELGHGPDSTVLVVQRLRRWMSVGKVTLEQIDAVLDMFDDAEDAGLPATEAAIQEIVPIIKRRVQHLAVRTAMSEYSNGSDFTTVKTLIDRADRLGVEDISIGTEVGGDSFAVIEKLRTLTRIPTGIPDLDPIIDKGLPRGGLTVAIGSSGAGKSIFLTHVTATAMRRKLLAAYATLELNTATVLARINANLTGIPINAILDGKADNAKRKIEAMSGLGRCVVKEFTARATTNEDIFSWVKQVEDRFGRKLDFLAIDYMDLVTAKLPKEKGEYEIARVVATGEREYAKREDLVVATAAQSKGRNEQRHNGRGRALDLQDVADSIHKVRIADLVLTLNGDDENENIMIRVAKNRLGKSRLCTPPLPTAFEVGMITQVGVE